MNIKKSEERISASMNVKWRLSQGLFFFFKGNMYILAMLLLFYLNKSNWRYDGANQVETFIFSFECFFILLILLVIVRPAQKKSDIPTSSIVKNLVGFIIAFIITGLISLMMIPAGLPFPSTMVFFILATNLLVAFYSLAFHKAAIALFKTNTEKEKKKIADYVFMYIAILFSGLNHLVQSVLDRQPLLINKLIALLFILLLCMQLITSGTIFTY
ncbi:hypothetical protein BME96_14950 [Virgibacillus halodenitrificans]|uniref:Uncharacterized protein n=1 Tax=Virgibacillus halodenitrificans TaxID=1482 RepID=A0AAC9J120_VIRHA|nr:hypothetical protein [Virgibacillus halodenitrificans]APC49411.1 hypothetical protein BME96_14950 [Virgibacillus halodenitrificans]MCJ0929955.1 hypothetical protein [Virgibacillus halodenitrificans]